MGNLALALTGSGQKFPPAGTDWQQRRLGTASGFIAASYRAGLKM